MNILVTGAKGFIGKNLIENLKSVKQRKNDLDNIHIDEIFEYDIDTDRSMLCEYCKKADFVFHFAGINRPQKKEEFMSGNFGFANELLNELMKNNNCASVVLSSSIQASLIGRYEDSEYGRSKLAGEELFFQYGRETGADVYVYRFPNLFGKWCRPYYNSVIATFCNAVANDLEYVVTDRNTEIELLYIDDLVNGLLDLLKGNVLHCEYDGVRAIESERGKFSFIRGAYNVSLGQIIDLLEQFKQYSNRLLVPSMPQNSFEKKLYSTYLSYLPKEKMSVPLHINEDARGSFTELIKTDAHGQVSINISKPGVTKGQHWHNTKWEMFIVVSGHGLIQERRIGDDKILEFEVYGDKPEVVYMLPGYTHNIINLSKTEDLVTVMWANEIFDTNCPDTAYEEV